MTCLSICGVGASACGAGTRAFCAETIERFKPKRSSKQVILNLTRQVVGEGSFESLNTGTGNALAVCVCVCVCQTVSKRTTSACCFQSIVSISGTAAVIDPLQGSLQSPSSFFNTSATRHSFHFARSKGNITCDADCQCLNYAAW